MYNRASYMKQEVTHREYYGQFVTEDIMDVVRNRIGVDALKASTDEHLNDICLSRWDRLAHPITFSVMQSNLTINGNASVSLSDCVCVLKEAARQIIEGA